MKGLSMYKSINLRDKIRKSHIIGQHCQRNYDLTKSIPQEDIDLIIHAATQCPSKQNLDFYSLYAIQDREKITNIYNSTITAKGRKNPQVLGQLLLVFVSNPNLVSFNDRNQESRDLQCHDKFNNNFTDLIVDMHQAIGVAAGFVNITSSLMGYRTGCCKCFDITKVKETLNLNDNQEPILMMGIGIKDESRNRRSEHFTDQIIDTFEKIPIQVHQF